MVMLRNNLLTVGFLVLLGGQCKAGERELSFVVRVKAGKDDLRNAPMSVTLNLPKLNEEQYFLKSIECNGVRVPAELSHAGIVAESAGKADAGASPYEIHWLDSLRAGEEKEFKALVKKV